jgi:predicted site-specific integrase-resolvase
MEEKPKSFEDYLTISKAAEFLGVHKKTLHRWQKEGKIRAFEHPFHKNWKIYCKKDLEDILNSIKEV